MSNRAERSVFRDRRRAGWVASAVVHAGVFAGAFYAVMSGPIAPKPVEAKVSVVEVEPPPPPPPPPPKVEEPPPPPPPPPPRAEPAPAPKEAPPPAPATEAPPIITSGEGDGPGDGFASGNNTDFGGSKGAAPKAVEAPKEAPKQAPKAEPPPPPPPPSAPREYDESELTVKPDIRCSPGRIAALYPQTAIDNDAEADIPVEVVVDTTGRITNPRAKTDPGFGLKEAAEKALLVACRPSAIPRDAQGNAVSARVVHTLHFQLE